MSIIDVKRDNSADCVRVEDGMSDKVYEIPAEWTKRAYIDDAKYRAMYERSVKNPNAFWAEQASAFTG